MARLRPARFQAVLVVGLTALAVCASAAAHAGHGRVRGMVSTVTGLRPAVLGVSVAVVGGDELRLSNYSRKTIVIFGYQGEPYLRFDRTGVYKNTQSTTTYVDRDINGGKAMPSTVTPTSRPVWLRVARGVSFAWHDNRIHWVGDIPPPAVQAAPDKPHLIRNWNVTGRVNARPFAINGLLGYAPPPGARGANQPDSGDSWALPVGLAGVGAAGLVAAGFVLARRKKRARRGEAAGSPQKG